MLFRWLCVAVCITATVWTGTASAEDTEQTRYGPVSRGRSWVVDVLEDRAIAHGISPWALITTARCESRLNPSAVGDEGEQGLFQLHAKGLRPWFNKMGYKNVWSVWESADFAAYMFSIGEATHWSCFWVEVLGRKPPWW